MADDSPGKVQALRAMFAEKNSPLMGMMPPGGRLSSRPWKSVADSAEDVPSYKERIIKEQRVSSQLVNKVYPFSVHKNPSVVNDDINRDVNGISENSLNKVSPKPFIGPKPTHISQQNRTSSSLSASSESSEFVKTSETRNLSDSQNLINSQAKSKAVAETIASFMFTNGFSQKESELVSTVANNKDTQPPIPKPRSCNSRTNLQDQINMMNSQNNHVSKTSSGLLNDLINSDNYICKSNCNFRRRELPSLETLGPAPLKPSKPSHMVLPSKYCSSTPNDSPASIRSSQPPPQHPPPSLPPKFIPPVPQRPGYPCPPRPHTPPPLPPVLAPVITPSLSFREEIEELYEDTLLSVHQKRPVSLIPEYTAEEEEAEELYNDAGPGDLSTRPTSVTQLLKPKDPPPPCPSEYLQPNVSIPTEELYQDAEDGNDEEFYEEMPCDTLSPDEPGSPVYSNNKKEIEKLQREEEKKVRKEQKEKEKREKELEKLRRKFGLTGEEIPIDDGLVKTDSRGGKGDLPVKRGETVLILRMEGNPSGRWLVKNEKGKIGYVELANIEVDPLSVKSVMTTRRLSVISLGEELYCEARSEEEGIYEVTY